MSFDEAFASVKPRKSRLEQDKEAAVAAQAESKATAAATESSTVTEE